MQNEFAFGGNGTSTTGVTIEYLTIEDFAPPGQQGAINPNSDDNWTFEHNTAQDNVPGAALMLGSNNTIAQNVAVSDNVFNFNASTIGSDCTKANYCGFNGLFSEYGSTTPYQAWVVPLNISDYQSNVFENNTYNGPWNFDGFSQGNTVDWSQWTAGFADGNGSNDFFNGQDAGSAYRA